MELLEDPFKKPYDTTLPEDCRGLEGFSGAVAWQRPWDRLNLGFRVHLKGSTVNPVKLETGLRPDSAGIPYTLFLRIEAIGFPTFGLLLYRNPCGGVPLKGSIRVPFRVL